MALTPNTPQPPKPGLTSPKPVTLPKVAAPAATPQGSLTWRAIRGTFNLAAKTADATFGAVWRHSGFKGRTALVAFTAAAATTAALTAGYFGAYGVAVAGDHLAFGAAYSSGTRHGQIVKVTEKGVFPCNTLEVELATQGFSSNVNGVASNVTRFSVRRFNTQAQEAVKAAETQGGDVSFTYRQSWWPTSWMYQDQDKYVSPFKQPLSCIQKSDYTVSDVKGIGTNNGVRPVIPPPVQAPGGR